VVSREGMFVHLLDVPGEVLSRQRTSVRHHLRQCSGEHDTATVHEAAQERPWFR